MADKKKNSSKPSGSAKLWIFGGLFLFVCIIVVIFFVAFTGFLNNSDKTNQQIADSIQADPITGLKSWAGIYWLGGGMIEVNIQTIDVTEPQETYDWDLKVVTSPSARLTTHFHETESKAGILTLNKELSRNGVYVFHPAYTQFLLMPWIEHNFGFDGVSVEPGMELQMFLVLHLDGGDHDVPIKLINN